MFRIIIVVLSVLFFSCKKEEKKYSVTYKVIETSNNTPSYTIRFTTNSGATQSQGPITAGSWNSGKLLDYKPGEYLKLEVEGSGGGEYQMYIYVNGAPDVNRIADDTNGAQSLETILPN